MKSKHGTYLRLSLWVLYSSIVFGGKLRTLRNVSRILAVVDESDAVLFHTDIISSYKHQYTVIYNIKDHRICWNNLHTFEQLISTKAMYNKLF